MRKGIPSLREDFGPGLSDHWQRVATGTGALEYTTGTLRLTTVSTSERVYSNAQIDDYQNRSRRDFLWHPPLTLTVRVRFSHPPAQPGLDAGLLGTAGFGFWNDPFMMTGRRRPTLPRAVWFFYSSPPSNMKLGLATPGYGWKAATIDALRWPFLFLAVMSPVVVPLMNISALYRALWPVAQRALRISETLVQAAMTDRHTYAIEWGMARARFLVDGVVVLDCDTPPRGPLGLVLWLDNQYLVATPWGRFRHGLLAAPAGQWLELDWLEIVPRGP